MFTIRTLNKYAATSPRKKVCCNCRDSNWVCYAWTLHDRKSYGIALLDRKFCATLREQDFLCILQNQKISTSICAALLSVTLTSARAYGKILFCQRALLKFRIYWRQRWPWKIFIIRLTKNYWLFNITHIDISCKKKLIILHKIFYFFIIYDYQIAFRN